MYVRDPIFLSRVVWSFYLGSADLYPVRVWLKSVRTNCLTWALNNYSINRHVCINLSVSVCFSFKKCNYAARLGDSRSEAPRSIVFPQYHHVISVSHLTFYLNYRQNNLANSDPGQSSTSCHSNFVFRHKDIFAKNLENIQRVYGIWKGTKVIRLLGGLSSN